MADIDISEDCMGSIGRWQIIMIALLATLRMSIPWHQLSIIFLAPLTDFKCSNSSIEKCDMSCPSHDFRLNETEETVINKWDLVCENEYLVALTQSFSMIGMFIGSIGIGMLSDIYGRKNTLIYSIVFVVFTGIATAFSPWFWLFMLLKFLSNVGLGGFTLNAFVIAMELVGKSYRSAAGALFQVPFFAGFSLLGLLGYLIRNWQSLQFTITIYSILFLPFFSIIPESPRWLLVNGRSDEAIEILQKAARFNGLETGNIKTKVANYMLLKSKEETITAGYLMDLVRTRNMRFRSISLFVMYFCMFFVYYGFSQYLGEIGDTYINIGISGAIQLPGSFICIYLMKKMGRKGTLVAVNILSSLACFLFLIIPEGMNWVYTVLGGIGLFFSGVSICTNYIHSGELFPTTVRSLGMGACSTFAYIGAAISPFIVGLKLKYPWLPPVLLGLLSLVPSLICFQLPETFNQKLPDTIEEVESADHFCIKRKSMIYVIQ